VVIKAHLHITDLVHAVIPEKRESEGFHMSSRWLLLAALRLSRDLFSS